MRHPKAENLVVESSPAAVSPDAWWRHACKRFMCVRFPVPIVFGYLALISLAYVFVVAHTPMSILAEGVHDDAFFMGRGRNLVEGEWMGPFSQFTLMKGPGYPLFLAAGNLLGLPVSLAHALFRIAAALVFVIVAQRLTRSQVPSGLLFALLVWTPASLMLTRVLRETNGNQSRAAEILGITRGKVRDRIAAFKIAVDTNVSINGDG